MSWNVSVPLVLFLSVPKSLVMSWKVHEMAPDLWPLFQGGVSHVPFPLFLVSGEFTSGFGCFRKRSGLSPTADWI